MNDIRILSRSKNDKVKITQGYTWRNNELADRIKECQLQVFSDAVKLISKMRFTEFPSIMLFKQNINSEFVSVIPRIDWKDNDSSEDIIKRYKSDIIKYEENFNPLLSVMFRPVLPNEGGICGVLETIIIGNTDGIVNVGYNVKTVRYGKVWNHNIGEPLSLEYFKEG